MLTALFPILLLGAQAYHVPVVYYDLDNPKEIVEYDGKKSYAKFSFPWDPQGELTSVYHADDGILITWPKANRSFIARLYLRKDRLKIRIGYATDEYDQREKRRENYLFDAPQILIVGRADDKRKLFHQVRNALIETRKSFKSGQSVLQVAEDFKKQMNNLQNPPPEIKGYSILILNALPIYKYKYGGFRKRYWLGDSRNNFKMYFNKESAQSKLKAMWKMKLSNKWVGAFVDRQGGINSFYGKNDKENWIRVEGKPPLLVIMGKPIDPKKEWDEKITIAIDRFHPIFRQEKSKPSRSPLLKQEIRDLTFTLGEVFRPYKIAVIYNESDPEFEAPFWKLQDVAFDKSREVVEVSPKL